MLCWSKISLLVFIIRSGAHVVRQGPSRGRGKLLPCSASRVDGRTLDRETFKSKYWGREPVILTNLMSDWPAVAQGRWEMRALLDSFGDIFVSSENLSPLDVSVGAKADMTLRDFLEGPHRYHWFLRPAHEIPKAMSKRADFIVPAVLEEIQAQGPYFSVGRRGQGGILHGHRHNWHAQVFGSKRWRLVTSAKGITENSSKRVEFEEARASPCDPVEPSLYSGLITMECIVGPLEILYLPHWTLHETCILDDFSVGLVFINSYDSKSIRVAASGNLTALEQLTNFKTLLPPAISSGHLAAVQFIVRQQQKDLGVDFDDMLFAAGAGQAHIMQYLLDLGMNSQASSNIDITKHSWKPEQMYDMWKTAAKYGHSAIAKLLFDRRVDPFLRDSDGRQLLHHCFGHAAIGSLLIGARADVASVDKKGYQPLHTNTAKGAALSKLLLEFRAEVSAATHDGETALHSAVTVNNVMLVEALVLARADPDVQKLDGHRPLHLAIAASVVNEGYFRVIRRLLELRAHVEGKTTNPTSLLNLAAISGHLRTFEEIADFLLKDGPNPGAQTLHDGLLHRAAGSGHKSMVNHLIDSGLEVDVNVAGEQPLHAAVFSGHAPIVARLVQLRSSIHATSDGERVKKILGAESTPIALAKKLGHKSVVSNLLKLRADVQAKKHEHEGEL